MRNPQYHKAGRPHHTSSVYYVKHLKMKFTFGPKELPVSLFSSAGTTLAPIYSLQLKSSLWMLDPPALIDL